MIRRPTPLIRVLTESKAAVAVMQPYLTSAGPVDAA
jgi:hypothetical protein